jgi:hypothetical protein
MDAGKVALSGSLPGKNRDGLSPMVDELLARPEELRLVVGFVSMSWKKISYDKRKEYPVAAWRQIEVVREEDAAAAADMIARAFAGRTDQVDMLPLIAGKDYEPPLDADEADEAGEEASL